MIVSSVWLHGVVKLIIDSIKHERGKRATRGFLIILKTN